MKKITDYYKLLGVEKNASNEDIEEAYNTCRNKILEGKSITELSPREIKAINLLAEAKETLRDRQTRRQYDFKLTLQKDSETKENDNGERKIDENLSDYIKRLYRDIKIEESKKSFTRRHKMISKKYKEACKKDNSSTDAIGFKLGSGTVHVFHEMFYQLHKLSYFNKETKPKFIIRNRKTIIGVLGATMLIASFASSNEESKDYEKNNFDNSLATEKQRNFIQRLIRVYKIKFGDTISQIAIDLDVDEKNIVNPHSINPDIIIAGENLRIHYYIDSEDLEYYTKTVTVGDKTLNETTIDTLCTLNEESIEKIGEEYAVLSDTLIVPNFITQEELKVLKENSINK